MAETPLASVWFAAALAFPAIVHVLPEAEILPEVETHPEPYLQPETLVGSLTPRILPEEERLSKDQSLEILKSDDHYVPSARSCCFPLGV